MIAINKYNRIKKINQSLIDLFEFKHFGIIAISFILLSFLPYLLFPQNITSREIHINNKPVKVNITNIRNSQYLTHNEFARILDLRTNYHNGKLTFSSAKYQLTFLRGSSFVIINHSGKEETKQMHLPVIESNLIAYLPFPTALTLLDSAGLINIQIEKGQQKIVKNVHPVVHDEVIVTEEITPDNIKQIQEIYNSVKNRPAKPITPPNKPVTPKPERSHQPNTKPEVKTEQKHIVQNTVEPTETKQKEAPHQETKTDAPTVNKMPDKKITEPTEIQHNIEPKMLDNEQKFNGYKIPNDIKRKRLQKLLGQDGI